MKKNTLNIEIENPCKMNTSIPFDSVEKAQLVLDVLKVDAVDPESDHHAKEQIFVEGNILHLHYTTDTPKTLRSCISSFYDKFFLITDLMKEFSELPAPVSN